MHSWMRIRVLLYIEDGQIVVQFYWLKSLLFQKISRNKPKRFSKIWLWSWSGQICITATSTYWMFNGTSIHPGEPKSLTAPQVDEWILE